MHDSAFGRLIGALAAPTKTFESISGKPTWLVPMVAMVVFGVLVTALVVGKIDFAEATRDAIEARGSQISEEQLETIVDRQEKLGPIFAIAGQVVVGPLIFLLVAVIFMVLFKMLGGELTFVKSLSVYLYSLMPRLVAAVLTVPVVLGKSEISAVDAQSGRLLASNPASFVSEDTGPGLLALLASLDLFSIWTLILLVIGYSIVARVSKGTAAVGVVGLWLVYVLGKVGLAAAFS